jgi:four helix bundle protein
LDSFSLYQSASGEQVSDYLSEGTATLIIGVHMREPAKTFEDLVVWQKAHLFVLTVYRLTEPFPNHEIYGLTSQFRRAAVSIAANIAEGFRKRNNTDKIRFLNIAQGSVEECRYYLILANDLGYANTSETKLLLQEVSKLLHAFSQSIQISES